MSIYDIITFSLQHLVAIFNHIYHIMYTDSI